MNSSFQHHSTPIAALIMAAVVQFCANAAEEGQKAMDSTPKLHKATLMSYNIRVGLGDEKQGWYRFPKGYLGYLPQVARVIRETRPTWVGIQEVDNGMHRTGFVDQMEVLALLTEMKGYFMGKTNFGEEVGEYGLGLLLKEEPISLKKIELGGPPKDHMRILFAAELKDAIVCSTHFSLNYANRTNAVEIIKKEFANPDKPVFIAGDFNCNLESEELKSLSESFTSLSGPEPYTFPSHDPSCHIDHIFVDKKHAGSIRVRSVETPDIDLLATDHRPLVVKVEISE